MKIRNIVSFLAIVIMLCSCGEKPKESNKINPVENMVRLSVITVDPEQLDEYNEFLREEIEASIRLEPGVLTLYAVSEKEQPNKVKILEIYANEQAYKYHIETPHFRKYKEGTLDMVQELELLDVNPLIPGLKIK
jgi:4-carboxymuconolactone decarboxylase